jgi:hypothetical protein
VVRVKITRVNEQTISIGPMDLFCIELLHQIRLSAKVDGDAKVQERLFPSPTGGRDHETDEEWREYVGPGLQDTFDSNLAVIEQDLRNFPPPTPADDRHTLHVPIDHLDAWIHGLNQARLAIAARYDFTEKEMEASIPMEGDTRALALFQVHFYGWLQESFLRVVDDEW